MKNILIGIFAIFTVLLVAGMASATVPVTMVSGEVLDASNNAVVGANVDVTCTHDGDTFVKSDLTDASGKYYVFFSSTECGNAEDGDLVVAHIEGAEDQSGRVVYNENCKLNTLKLNLQIPEFGVIGGAIVLLAGIGIVAYRRK